MPRLIHLNGPPGIGKSTLARRYVDERFGVLDLDVDRVRDLIGGSRERFAEAGELARVLALGMAATHLTAGRDVVLPQYVGRLSEVGRFERVARESGAEFREVFVMDGRQRSVERFFRRGAGDRDSWHEQVRQVVEQQDGAAALAAMHDQLGEVLAAMPGAEVLTSTEDEVEATYRDLVALLDR